MTRSSLPSPYTRPRPTASPRPAPDRSSATARRRLRTESLVMYSASARGTLTALRPWLSAAACVQHRRRVVAARGTADPPGPGMSRLSVIELSLWKCRRSRALVARPVTHHHLGWRTGCLLKNCRLAASPRIWSRGVVEIRGYWISGIGSMPMLAKPWAMPGSWSRRAGC